MTRILTLLLLVLCSSSVVSAQMQYPLAVTADKEGSLFVADRNLPGIWKITDGKAEMYFEGSKKFRTPLNAVRCVAMDEKGRLLAGDSSTREVYRFDEKGEPIPLTDGWIGIPMAIAVAKTGEIYVADLELHRIWKVPALGGQPEEVATGIVARGMTIDDEGKLWIVSHGEKHLLRLDPKDKSVEVIVEGQPFNFAHHIALGEDQTPFVIDGYAKTLWKVTDGKPVPFFQGEPLKNPVGLTFREGVFYVADPHQKAIYAIDKDGKLTQFYPQKD